MKQRVAITGLGVVSPIGLTVEAFAQNLSKGVSGIRPISVFDASTLPSRIAGEVPWTDPIARDRKQTFAIEAARQAMAQATACGSWPAGIGTLSLGIGLELFSLDDMAELGAGRGQLPDSIAARLTFLQTPSDLCAHTLAHQHGLTAPPRVHVSACAAGTDAIGAGYRLVATGRSDWVLAGGADSMINPLGVGGFCKLSALSRRNSEPVAASRPFDRGRDGFVLGEGAAMLVLEPLDNALRRGAEILAELCGYGNSFDAFGISEPHPEGRGAVQAMERALADAGLRPEQVDVINSHGTGTPKNDVVETLAIKRVFSDHARRMPVCATKSMIGHLISAAGAVEAVASIVGLRGGWVHPTLNLDDPDPACDLNYVPRESREWPAAFVMSNSFAFGGQNASVIFRRADAA
ncbi:MAG: beta-ketoacyl-[acyl-carrier-protein] synthase II [Verrucomicrobia bacterium]|nr:MAG: beta-ketoacyl-[acyl-carrier-protein] synthase II [Verrucomicrobiota bacterium]